MAEHHHPRAHVHSFFDTATSTATHIISSGDGTPAAIIDSVLDYDLKSGRTSRASADKVIAYVQEHKLHVEWILETHVHADHLTAAQYLKQKLGGKVAIGAQVKVVQEVFGKLFNLPESVPRDGSQFDHLFADGETFRVGPLEAKVMTVPGHTPADVCYVIDGLAFVGDSIFHPDVGSARCDFPGGDARQLYKSVHKILALPPTTQLYLCHDYPSEGRSHVFTTTVQEQLEKNKHFKKGGLTEEEFVAQRTARDKTLQVPQLIIPSVQINLQAGHFPPKDSNGVSYLRVPLDTF